MDNKKENRGGHSKISPNCIYSLKDEKIGYIAKAMLVRLAHLACDLEEIFYSNEKLAEDLNISVRSVVNAMNELQKEKYIKRDKSHFTGTKLTELNHKRIIEKLFEKPNSKRHVSWLEGYYEAPKGYYEKKT